MIHVRDVIKWSLYWTDQKSFTDHSFEMIHFMTFSNQNYLIFNSKECRYWFEIIKNISGGQEMTRAQNCFTNHTPEVKERKSQILFSIDSLHNWQCRYFIFILFIISVIKRQIDQENLPIVSWNFFCELLVYVTCDTSNWSPEGTDLKNNHIETNWSSDRKLE